VYRVAARLAVQVYVVSNFSRPLRPPDLPNVRLIMVGDQSDAADDWIDGQIRRGDVCITADIPLASRCLKHAACAVAPNGHEWTTANIGSALAGRELSRHLRELGVATRGPTTMTRQDRSRFLSTLDTVLRRAMRETGTTPPA
jgi:uncharacterized protein YaiI (UPF0178 family)